MEFIYLDAVGYRIDRSRFQLSCLLRRLPIFSRLLLLGLFRRLSLSCRAATNLAVTLAILSRRLSYLSRRSFYRRRLPFSSFFLCLSRRSPVIFLAVNPISPFFFPCIFFQVSPFFLSPFLSCYSRRLFYLSSRSFCRRSSLAVYFAAFILPFVCLISRRLFLPWFYCRTSLLPFVSNTCRSMAIVSTSEPS